MWASAVREVELKTELGGAPAYMYQFGWKEPCFGGAWSIHGAELPFIFDKLNGEPLYDDSDTAVLRAQADPTGDRFKLRDAVIAAWSGFARHGTPDNPLLPAWPSYGKDRAAMWLGRTSEVVNDPAGPTVRRLFEATI
jgi:para-nitrobenzyl esterase